MPTKLRDSLKSEKIQWVKKRVPVTVPVGTPLKEVVSAMQKEKRGCVLVVGKKGIAGIFTERDLMRRVLGNGVPFNTPVDEVMTKEPTLIRGESSVADAIKIMSEKGHRNLPIVDAKGGVQGLVTVRDLVSFLAEHFPYEVYNLPPDPKQIQRTPEGA